MRARRLAWPRLPLAAWLCALVALLNSLAWALLTPPFQVPDEISHVAYVQHLAETGNAPRHVSRSAYSTEQLRTMEAARFEAVVLVPGVKPPWTELERELLESVAARRLPRDDGGGSSTATNNPPLFYALETVPYRIARGGDLLDRLAAMRLLSALMSALTVLCVFLFLRELLPGSRLAWTVGALVAAFQPMFGFIASGVNGDSGLYLAAAALFALLARAFRRGLGPGSGAALGLVAGLGLVTKLTFVAFAPAVAVALVALVVRAGPERRRSALGGAAAAVLCAAVPGLAYLALNSFVWDRALYGGGGGLPTEGVTGRAGSLRELLSYSWQLYLPRLPFQQDLVAGTQPWTLWFRGLVGRFGWLGYGFRPWLYELAAAVALVTLAFTGDELWRRRGALRRRLPEALTYAVAVVALLAAIASPSYDAFVSGSFPFEQARYLLPLLPLYAALVALAARSLARRFGAGAAALLVVLAAGHGLFAQLITISRYYT